MLEQITEITSQTCANHIRVLRKAYLSEDEIKHRNCTGTNTDCPNYIPVERTQLRFSHLRLYMRG